MPLLDLLPQLQLKATQTGDYSQLESIYNTIDYKKLSYVEKNRGVITAHKLMSFARCQWCYEKQYIDELPNRNESSDALILGSAFDDLLTEGDEFFAEKYEVVTRRNQRTQEKHIGKELLSNSMHELLTKMKSEFRANSLFSQNPKKKILLADYKGLILKVELDDVDEQNAIIRDIKTAANIITFYKEMARLNEKFIGRSKYLFQMTFYFFVVNLVLEQEYNALLQVVDKKKEFSRSGAWVFDRSELRCEVYKVTQLLDSLKLSHDSGCFWPTEDQTTLYDCPYYGIEGHGRPNKYF